MKNIMKTLGVVAAWVLMITSAQADSFINPPESNAPAWSDPFPYQRNIHMGFAVDPVASPSPSGIPGATYEGRLDSTLKVSDYVTLGGSASWYATASGITPTGLIGIDNRQGSSLLTGTATIHIDNTAYESGFKNIWLETLTYTSLGGASANIGVSDPLGNPATYLGGLFPSSYGGGFLSDFEYQITPNPAYETIEYSFEAPAGTWIFIDDAHIGTVSVPEPGAVGLLALGSLGLLRRRRKQGGKA